ncbi:MAG: hypothetical protein JNM52_01680, partial [Betaproteobacteria bacterium]|nr:hypothetical protein [Betaproteobacteria bacterium]
MWFIGLLAGLILGGIAAQGVGALWGGLLGATIGLMIQNWQRRHNHELETRLQALESTLDALNQRLRRLEISRSTATPVASPTATPVAS